MQKIVLPFLGQELEIFLAHKLNATKLFDLEELLLATIDANTKLIGLSQPNSEVMRLNDSDLNYPVEVSPQLWEYLLLNVTMANRSEGKLVGFSIDRQTVDHRKLAEMLVMEQETHAVRRLQPIMLNPASLAAPFVFQRLETSLLKNSFTNFLISFHNLHVAHGSDSWEIALSQPDSQEDLHLVIANEAVYMQILPAVVLDPEVTASGLSNPFRTVKIPRLTFAAIIVEAVNLIEAKLIAAFAIELSYEHEIQALADKWHCGITLIMRDGEIKQYSAQA